MTLEELKKARDENRAALAALDKARDGGDFTAEQVQEVEKRLGDDAQFAANIAAKEAAAKMDAWKKQPAESAPAVIVKASGAEKRRELFVAFVKGKISHAEFTAQTQESDSAGGYLHPASIHQPEIIDEARAESVILNGARWLPPLIGSDRASWPTIVSHLAAGQWGGESDDIIAASGARTMEFGIKELQPALCSFYVPLSNKLLVVSDRNVEQMVRDEINATVAETLEDAFINGDGEEVSDGGNKPIGILAEDDNGIPASRTIETAKAGIVQADDLLDLTYAIEAQHWPHARVMLSPRLAAAMRKMKNGNGDYIWTGPDKDLPPGAAGRVNGIPAVVVPKMTGNIESGEIVAAIGNLQNYYVLPHREVGIQRADWETYSKKNQFVLILRTYLTACPFRPNTWARLKVR